MKSDPSFVGTEVSITRSDRWQAYQRLQDLNIPCVCPADGSLQVNLDTPLAAIQLWSVVKQLTTSRQDLADWLKYCWSLPST
ncbi:MAG TPA: Asr1405/Asl0597 family protein [Coleofasciculaceae cyanobacterium]